MIQFGGARTVAGPIQAVASRTCDGAAWFQHGQVEGRAGSRGDLVWGAKVRSTLREIAICREDANFRTQQAGREPADWCGRRRR